MEVGEDAEESEGEEDEESDEDEEELHRVRTFFMQMLQNHFTIDEILQMHPAELQRRPRVDAGILTASARPNEARRCLPLGLQLPK